MQQELWKARKQRRAYRRQQRRRIIRRRLWQARTFGADPVERPWWRYKAPGQASKNNTVCSCGLCRASKYRDKPRRRSWA